MSLGAREPGMRLNFESGGLRCAASHFRPTDMPGVRAPCVVMAHGFTGTRDQLTCYAETFARAGLAALTFDYRHFGESEGSPRQIVDIGKQMEDWRSAIAMARTLDRVDSTRIALWGSSLSGGHVINLAAEDPTLAAVVAQVPAIDKSAHGISAEVRAKTTREGISVGSLIAVSLRSLVAGIYDEVRGLVGLSPHYIAVFGRPGQVAAFTDREWESHLAVFARGPTWRNEFAPRFLFRTPKYVHGTAERIRMPLLVCVAEQDTEANPELAIDIARKAPRGVVKTYAARHFDFYTGDVLQQMLSDQTAFLREHLSVGPAEEGLPSSS